MGDNERVYRTEVSREELVAAIIPVEADRTVGAVEYEFERRGLDTREASFTRGAILAGQALANETAPGTAVILRRMGMSPTITTAEWNAARDNAVIERGLMGLAGPASGWPGNVGLGTGGRDDEFDEPEVAGAEYEELAGPARAPRGRRERAAAARELRRDAWAGLSTDEKLDALLGAIGTLQAENRQLRRQASFVGKTITALKRAGVLTGVAASATAGAAGYVAGKAYFASKHAASAAEAGPNHAVTTAKGALVTDHAHEVAEAARGVLTTHQGVVSATAQFAHDKAALIADINHGKPLPTNANQLITGDNTRLTAAQHAASLAKTFQVQAKAGTTALQEKAQAGITAAQEKAREVAAHFNNPGAARGAVVHVYNTVAANATRLTGEAQMHAAPVLHHLANPQTAILGGVILGGVAVEEGVRRGVRALFRSGHAHHGRQANGIDMALAAQEAASRASTPRR